VQLDQGAGLMRLGSGAGGPVGATPRVAQMTLYLPDAELGVIVSILSWGHQDTTDLTAELKRVADSVRIVEVPAAADGGAPATAGPMT
jgi:hypothetical protein